MYIRKYSKFLFQCQKIFGGHKYFYVSFFEGFSDNGSIYLLQIRQELGSKREMGVGHPGLIGHQELIASVCWVVALDPTPHSSLNFLFIHLNKTKITFRGKKILILFVYLLGLFCVISHLKYTYWLNKNKYKSPRCRNVMAVV